MFVTLLVPALNEEAAIGRTADVVRAALDTGIVDAAYVVDGGSGDDTVEVARSHGIPVLVAPDLLANLGPVLGKGDALFRAVHTVDADWYVFLDADIGNVGLGHIAPLADAARRTDARFVKGGFVRIDEAGRPRAVAGGRVTEEVGRPLLAQVDEYLSALSQPLSGQIAIESGLARHIPFATGYGLEIAMLIDVWRTVGRAGMLEVDIGLVHNRWKNDEQLDDVRDEVISGAVLRGVVPNDRLVNTHSHVVLRCSDEH